MEFSLSKKKVEKYWKILHKLREGLKDR